MNSAAAPVASHVVCLLGLLASQVTSEACAVHTPDRRSIILAVAQVRGLS